MRHEVFVVLIDIMPVFVILISINHGFLPSP
jgi:hypothetical protein